MNGHIWTLILAAGESRRFGGIKARATWAQGTLLSRAVDQARRLSENRVCVVLGCHADELKADLSSIMVTFNPNWQKGMGTSIAWGLQVILDKDPSVIAVVLLAIDQPLTTDAHLKELVRLSHQTSQSVLTRSEGSGFGPPALISEKHFDKALKLDSDRGLKSVLDPQEFTSVQNTEALLDADTPEELQKLYEMYTARVNN